MKLVGRLDIEGHGSTTIPQTITPNHPPMTSVAEIVAALMLRVKDHLIAGTFMHLTIELDGRLIYQTTFGKKFVKRITYRPEDIDDGF